MTDPLAPAPLPSLPDRPMSTEAAHDRKLRDAAQALEASFLAEMLKSAGFGEPRKAFGGGTGEDRFASFLRQEHARAIVEAGGLGLAESLYHSLKGRPDGTR